MSEQPAAFIVALDGPAGAGKSTIARRVAQAMGFTLLDTGAIYRTVALACERASVPFDDPRATGIAEALVTGERMVLLRGAETGMKILLDGVEVGEAIRTPTISMGASTVSATPGVRNALLDVQRRFARGGTTGLVAEGRDIGTVIFPDADLKIFLTASVDERARRRHGELLGKPKADPTMTFEKTRADVMARDKQDESRAVAPLRQADDAVVVDSTGAEVDTTVGRVLALVRTRLQARDARDTGGQA